MLISFCIPAHNRLADLKISLPYVIAATQISPPAEVVILDYGSTDGLREYARGLAGVTYRRYEAKYFHKAHAFNLAILASRGEYFVLLGTDACPHPDYLKIVRERIAAGCVWMVVDNLRGIITCEREEFIAAGGYDERFEFYGPEDKDLEARLIRRGKKHCVLPMRLMRVFLTPEEDKVKNYRLKLTKARMIHLMRRVYRENMARGVLVANEGREWGKVDAQAAEARP